MDRLWVKRCGTKIKTKINEVKKDERREGQEAAAKEGGGRGGKGSGAGSQNRRGAEGPEVDDAQGNKYHAIRSPMPVLLGLVTNVGSDY